jgi:DNA phosphorothioation-dependent restriction protein DptG
MINIKRFPLAKSYRSNETTRCLVFPKYTTRISYTRARSELIAFEGILGAACRSNAGFSPDVSDELTATIFEKSSSVVATSAPDGLRSLLLDLYSGEGQTKIRRFAPQSLTYLKPNKTTHKDDHSGLRGFGEYVNAIFLPSGFFASFDAQQQSSLHLADQVMLKLLPSLSTTERAQARVKRYFENSLVAQFRKDILNLAKESNLFLGHMDELVRIYLFHYLIGVARTLNKQIESLKGRNTPTTGDEYQFHYLLEGERASSSRVGVASGWKSVKNSLDSVFTHINCLQLLNHIELAGSDDVHDYSDLSQARNNGLQETLKSLMTEFCSIAPNSGMKFKQAKKLTAAVETSKSVGDVVCAAWTSINDDIQKSEKKSPADKISNWIRGLGYGSLLQNRVGYVSVLPLRYVQLIVALVVREAGQDRVRLKDLWAGFGARGLQLDEASKAFAITHFEDIGIVETKSDSGDARYVRAPF